MTHILQPGDPVSIEDLGGNFGFIAGMRYVDAEHGGSSWLGREVRPQYLVRLPHQTVIDTDDVEDAVARMKDFIEEAVDALLRLQDLQRKGGLA